MGRTRKAGRGEELWLVVRLLRAWAKAGEEDLSKAKLLGTQVLNGFASSSRSAGVVALANNPVPVDLSQLSMWIIGPPTPGEPPAYPVATAAVRMEDDGSTGLTIRVALFSEVVHDEVSFAVRGWRFESREVRAKSPRPFPHAQPTLGWHIDGSCMLHPHASSEESVACSSDRPWPGVIDGWRESMNCEQPGFPLRGVSTSLVSQTLSVLVTLYGVERTREILDYESELQEFTEQLRFTSVFG